MSFPHSYTDEEVWRRFQRWALLLDRAEAQRFWDDVDWLKNAAPQEAASASPQREGPNAPPAVAAPGNRIVKPEEMFKELSTGPSCIGWISAADDLPDTIDSVSGLKHSPYCLVWVPGWAHPHVSQAVFLADNDQFLGWVGYGLAVTHWMPLPPYPKQSATPSTSSEGKHG